MLEAPAIDLNGPVLSSEYRNVLVHNAAGHADKFNFGLLAELGDLEFVEVAAIEESERARYLKRRR